MIHLPGKKFAALATVLFLVLTIATGSETEKAIDASDPTRIYSFMGGGPKYNSYTNSDYMIEMRVIGNFGLSDRDMILFEGGYGWHDGELASEEETDNGFTDIRLRYFHTVAMKYEVKSGYRGWGTQVDVQLAGQVRGTDGQNQVLVGVMPTFALGGDWNLYLITSVANTWDRAFEKWNGVGPSVTAQFIWDPEGFWPGAQIRIIPSYTYFVAGSLENDGSGELEFNVGGEITSTVMWDATLVKNFDVDLKSYRSDPFTTELENDWNLFFNVTAYF